MQNQAFVEKCIFENLNSVGVSLEKTSQGLRVTNGISLLQIQDVQVWEHENSGAWIAHINVVFALNPEMDDSFIYDCATGWDNDPEAALSLAAQSTCKTSAPTFFSLLNSGPVLEAEFFPPDDPLGFPGWEAFSSPYICKGDHQALTKLTEYIQENPLLSNITNLLENSFEKPMLNTIRLYLAFDGTKYHAECRVNNKIHLQAQEVLLNSNLPKLDNFASINQFLLLLHKPSAQ